MVVLLIRTCFDPSLKKIFHAINSIASNRDFVCSGSEKDEPSLIMRNREENLPEVGRGNFQCGVGLLVCIRKSAYTTTDC